jgi:hypothetical protein
MCTTSPPEIVGIPISITQSNKSHGYAKQEFRKNKRALSFFFLFIEKEKQLHPLYSNLRSENDIAHKLTV